MNKTKVDKHSRRHTGGQDWVWEILIFVTVLPALVFGITSIGNLPLA